EAAPPRRHQEEAPALEDTAGLPRLVAPRVPVRDVTELLLDVGLEARLLVDLARGRDLRRLPRLDVALRDRPEERAALRVAPRGEDDQAIVAPAAVDEPACREL